LKILFIGDIIGKPGRRAVTRFVPELRKEYDLDFVIANVENVAGGFGLTKKSYDQVMEAGVDCATSGNHIYDRDDVFAVIKKDKRLLRPANYGVDSPGVPTGVYKTKNGELIGVGNLSGQLFMKSEASPFELVSSMIDELKLKTEVVLLDFHAEATSEKVALGWHLDGKISALLGTHTHIPTADARLLDEGTAYMTDVGMTGAYDSVIGIKTSIAIKRFVTGSRSGFDVAKKNIQLHAALIEVDSTTGRARSIEHIVRHLPPGQ
jgi:2',3'-cyclic-nucleotide 2'-phosphodiesterase